MKSLWDDPSIIQDEIAQVAACWQLPHELQVGHALRRGVAALQEVVDDPGGNKMLLVMDYMEGGPVLTREGLERGRRIPEPLALQYFRDMCKVCSRAVGSMRHSRQL